MFLRSTVYVTLYLERVLANSAVGLQKVFEVKFVSEILCCEFSEVNVWPCTGYSISHVLVWYFIKNTNLLAAVQQPVESL